MILGHKSEYNPPGMIVALGLLAIAFSTQLLPLTVDMLYLKKGTRQGAIAGLVTGLATIFLLSPFFPMLAGNALEDMLASTSEPAAAEEPAEVEPAAEAGGQ